jgi:hypothetical protein
MFHSHVPSSFSIPSQFPLAQDEPIAIEYISTRLYTNMLVVISPAKISNQSATIPSVG